MGRKNFRMQALLAFVLLVSLVFAVNGIWSQNTPTAEAARLVQQATASLIVPKPGQIAHYMYSTYSRVPPAMLEPTDPYHMPYKDIWTENGVIEKWLEIGTDGTLKRWHTKLFSASGKLLQELASDGLNEVDYFVQRGQAFESPVTKPQTFVDDRVDFYNRFVVEQHLEQHVSLNMDRKQVLSVYTSHRTFSTVISVKDSLLNFDTPFISDLQPVSMDLRLDFDPTTLTAIGYAEVAYDHFGAEHILSYRSLSNPDIISPTDNTDVAALFDVKLPTGINPIASNDANSPQPATPGNTMTDLATIARSVTFPIYGLPASDRNFHLVSTDYLLPSADKILPQELLAIDFASAIGAGVRTVYIVPNASQNMADPLQTLSFIQGPQTSMLKSLQSTRPTWTESHVEHFLLAGQDASAWVMPDGRDNRKVKYVVQGPTTLIYIDTVGVPDDQVQSILSELVLE